MFAPKNHFHCKNHSLAVPSFISVDEKIAVLHTFYEHARTLVQKPILFYTAYKVTVCTSNALESANIDRTTRQRKTCPCNEYPPEPHFYIAKLGYAGVCLFFLFLLQNIDCGYSLEPPRRGGSNAYPQSMF